MALREELARALMRVAFDPSDKDVVRSYARDWNARLDDANAILPIIARERAAALAAATPLIEARVREECVAAVRSVPHGPGCGVANCEAAIRKGRP